MAARLWENGRTAAMLCRLFSTQVIIPQRPSRKIETVLEQYGPQTIKSCWKLVEPLGIPSKTRMKTILRWLVEKNRVVKICNPLKQADQKKKGGGGARRQQPGSQAKEFLFSVRLWKRKDIKRLRAAREAVRAEMASNTDETASSLSQAATVTSETAA